ncbi:hypothetical protein [Streptomyces sp. NPDC001933]|uniref:hypothetical protein n=1 Tax=Streptomyces sp. NPDC001933 TaxID=3364626 RepID=UPI0036BFAD76
MGTLVQLTALLLSGFAFPVEFTPDAVRITLGLLPTSFFAGLMLTQMSQGDPVHPVWLSILIAAAIAVVAVFIAVRTSKWDQGDTE